ncbi:MAG: Uma2 family endonuclease, partial [Eubacteriales bacterium]|nr:Uma2 family endonuclease [Eubacteriales bacterium]
FKKDFKEPDVMQPDLLVACDLKDNVTEKGRYMGTPTLVIEILSPGTRTKDMIDKLNTYALSGVQEYWIVDQSQEKILLYSFKENEIDEFGVYARQEIASSFVFSGLNLDVDLLFAELL